MKSPDLLLSELNKINKRIEDYFDRLTDAMCSGDRFKESQYEQEISYLENRKEMLEWVLA